MVLGVSIQVVDGLADYWTMIEATNGFWVVPSHILETNGGIDYLRKHSLYEISRGQSQTIDQLIEGLIQCGYSHAHHLGELATYQRSGSVVTITEATSGNQIHIEWFDTEIDSILEIDARSSERRHRDTVTIKTQNLSSTPIERKI
jgi:transcription-repair coupling factor (superfamily II helicase)